MRELLIFLIVLIPACSNSAREFHHKDYNKEENIIVQVCLPNKNASAPESIIITSIKDGSIISGGESLTGNTIKQQPVFETYIGNPTKVLAVLASQDNKTNYIFRIKGNNVKNQWGPWVVPSKKTNEKMAAHRILKDKELFSEPPEVNAPLARFRIMQFGDYLKNVANRRDHGLDTGIPACQ